MCYNKDNTLTVQQFVLDKDTHNIGKTRAGTALTINLSGVKFAKL